MIVIETVTEAMIRAARRAVSGFRCTRFNRRGLAGVGLVEVPSGVIIGGDLLRIGWDGALKRKRIRSRLAVRADDLCGRAGGLVERGANPVVLAAGIQASEELRERAMPAVAAAVGGPDGDGLPHLCVLAADEHDGRARTCFGEDLVGPLLIRPDVRFPLVGC